MRTRGMACLFVALSLAGMTLACARTQLCAGAG